MTFQGKFQLWEQKEKYTGAKSGEWLEDNLQIE